MRELAGANGLTPSLLFSRSRKEVEKGVTAASRGWTVRKIDGVSRESQLKVSSQEVLASGGLPSKCDDERSKSLYQADVKGGSYQAPSDSLVQVDYIYKKAQCDEVSNVMQMDVASDNLAQVDNCMQRGCDLVQVDNNFILRKDSDDCDIAQVDYYCYNGTHSSVSEVVQVDNIVNESLSSSVAQVDNIVSSPMASDEVVQVVNNSYITLPCDVVQVDNIVNKSPGSSDGVVQVDNSYIMLKCDIVQVENDSYKSIQD